MRLLGVTLVSAVLFRVVYELTAIFGVAFPAWYRELDEGGKRPVSKLKWRNVFVSFVHSSLMSVASLAAFMLDDKVYFNSWLVSATVAVSNGYFVHELIEILQHNLFWDSHGLLHFHHVVVWSIPLAVVVESLQVIGCFSWALYEELTLSYLVLTLICEVNNVFLHLSGLLRKCGYDATGRLLRTLDALMIVTFVIFRFAVFVWVTVDVYLNRDQFPKFSIYLTAQTGMVAMLVMSVLTLLLFVKSRGKMDTSRSRKEE